MTPDLVEIAHEREIVNLTVRYAWALDNRRFDDLAEVFTPDATADLLAGSTHNGLPEIIERISSALAPFDRTQHICTNHQITVNGDRAKGRCYLQAQHVTKSPGADSNYVLAGNYLDEYVLADTGWRISHRALRVTWTDGSRPPSSRPRTDTSFVIAGWIDVDPDRRAELLQAAVIMSEATLEEPGNQEYSFAADPGRPERIRVFERWRSEADLRGHFDAPHMVVFQEALAKAGVRDRDLARFHVSDVSAVFDPRRG